MTGPIFQRGATAKVGRRRSFPVRPAAAALALSAALAIPALTVASGSAMAVTASGAAAHKVHRNRPDAGQAVTAATGAAGTASRTVLAWGRNTTGQLGDGTTTSTSTPVRVHLPAGTEVTQVQAAALTRWLLPPGVRCWPGEATPTVSSATAALPTAPPRSGSSCPAAPRSPRSGLAASTVWP